MRLILLIAALLLTPTLAFAHPTSPEHLVRVYVTEQDGGQSMGSGVLISPTQILTNYHVAGRRARPKIRMTIRGRITYGENKSLQVRFRDGSRAYATVIKEDRMWDCAVMQIPAVTFKPITIGEDPKQGDFLRIAGFGGDYEYRQVGNIWDGTVQSPHGSKIFDFIKVKGHNARRGDSGGHMINNRGELVGLLYGSTLSTAEPSFSAVKISRVISTLGAAMKPSNVKVPENELPTDYNLRLNPAR